MAKVNAPLLAFNRGVVTRRLQGREDIDKMRWASEIQTNWMPRIFGSMMVRPGTEYIHEIYNNLYSRSILFTRSISEQAIIEFTDNNFRIMIDEIVLSRVAVSTAITNGTFTSNITGWTDDSDTGGATTWKTGGYLQITGDGDGDFGKIYQLVTVSGSDINKEHGLRIVIERNNVTLKIGSTLGGNEYFGGNIGHGEHSIAFTPTGNFYIQFESNLERQILINSVAIEGAGDVLISTPYTEEDIDYIRYDQSADVIYLACRNYSQRKIERRSARSWSLVYYEALDGPFRFQNTSPITISASAQSGNITLTASQPIFETGHEGALFEIRSIGQLVSETIEEEDVFTDEIRISGIQDARKFTIKITGTFVATLTLQRRFDESEAWEDVVDYTVASTIIYDDGLDNQIVFYRIGVSVGNYTSGSVFVSLKYSLGSKAGIVRITDYNSSVSVDAEVIVTLGRGTASPNWSEGYWSDFRGFPSVVSLHEGRLHWTGRYYIFSSVSDGYESFDQNTEGDSAPIIKSLGSGITENLNWSLSLNRLIIGAETTEKTLRSNSFDEPLTPSNANIKDASTVGNSYVYPVKINQTGLFSKGFNIYELTYDVQSSDYSSVKINHLCPEICQPYIVRMGLSKEPDTRVHFVRSDGKVAILIYDPLENIKAFVLYETDGFVEDVLVQKGDINALEDKVYYTVRRTINGITVRYRERWSLESECVGGSLNKNLDCSVVKNPIGSLVGGLSHLEGKTVKIWGSGKDLGEYVVSGGNVTLSQNNISSVVVGLPFLAQYKSMKMLYASRRGTALLQIKRISEIGFFLENTHVNSLKYGSDFATLYDLPRIEDGVEVQENEVYDVYDKEMTSFGDGHGTDKRVCLQVESLPCTIISVVLGIETND